MESLKVFIPLWKFIKKEKFKFIIATILIFISSMSFLFIGYLNGAAIESISKLYLKRALIFLGAYLFVEMVLDLFCSRIASNILQRIENRVSRELSYETYSKCLKLPAYAYEKKSSGEIINRITTDSESLSYTFGRVLNLITYIISTVVIYFYICYHSWIIGVLIAVFVCLIGLVMKHFNPLVKKTHKARKDSQDKFISITNESIRGIREIKTLGIKPNLLTETKNVIKEIMKKSYEETEYNIKYRISTGILRILLEVSTFVLCAILMYHGKITLGFFVSMTYYIYRYTWLMEEISDFSEMYQKLIVSLERVNEIIENKLFEDEKFGDQTIKDVKGVIEFKNVDFAYPGEKTTLKNFNLTLEPNKKIAIVGRSGQGKSTVFNLLTRVFDVKKGKILLDGVDIRDLTEEDLRKNISIIRQEPFIFNRSIKENFKLVNSKIRLNEIKKYTQMAYLDEYIMSLPKKYDTILGEGGVNLSGGQKQRLAIARTLAKGSKVILFDEATSALDNSSQEYVKETIDDLVKDHTVIVVAHRLSTIIDADVIYVIDGGKVVASGTHEELLKSSEEYKTLYNA